MAEIIPAVVPKIFEDIASARKRYGAFAPTLHIDIADGVFAPNTTWMIKPGDTLPDPTIAYEIHLMIENPLQFGMMFARAGATRVIGHIEAFPNADCGREAFDMWQKAGAKETGVAILLDTPLEDLMLYIQLCDFVHMMSIAAIGKQGAPFDERAIERVAEIHKRYPTTPIAVDGGENEKNMALLAGAGATRFCVGSALSRSKDPSRTYSQLLNVVEII